MGTRIVVSKIKGEIQVITVPQCRCVAFEVVQSLGIFRKAKRSTPVRDGKIGIVRNYGVWD